MAGYNECKVLTNCNTSLLDRLAAGNVSRIGHKLHTKGLVPFEAYSQMQAAATPEDKAEQIALAVFRTMRAQPQKFGNLVESLKEESMPELAEKLQEELREVERQNENTGPSAKEGRRSLDCLGENFAMQCNLDTKWYHPQGHASKQPPALLPPHVFDSNKWYDLQGHPSEQPLALLPPVPVFVGNKQYDLQGHPSKQPPALPLPGRHDPGTAAMKGAYGGHSTEFHTTGSRVSRDRLNGGKEFIQSGTYTKVENGKKVETGSYMCRRELCGDN